MEEEIIRGEQTRDIVWDAAERFTPAVSRREWNESERLLLSVGYYGDAAAAAAVANKKKRIKPLKNTILVNVKMTRIMAPSVVSVAKRCTKLNSYLATFARVKCNTVIANHEISMFASYVILVKKKKC